MHTRTVVYSLGPLVFLLSLLVMPRPGYAQPTIYPIEPRTYEAARTGGNYMFNFYLPPPGSSYPWWPEWSPDGAQIAFSLHGTIWLLDLETHVAEELVHINGYLSSPAWHGQDIVFTVDDGRAINLYIHNLNTRTTEAITEGSHLNLDPAWSPDGTRLAYVSTWPDGYFNVWIRDMATGESQRVTEDHTFGRNRLYFGDHDLHIQPAWIPGSDELLILSNRGIPLGSGGVWRIPIQQNAMTEASLVHKEETLYRTRADIAPDGTRFVYSSHLGGQFNQLFVLPVNGGAPYKMTFGEWDHFHPRFSPDGHRIVYVSNEGGLPTLRMLETFGGKDTPVIAESYEWSVPTGQVRVNVEDAETGARLPSRIYNRASDGKSYAPSDAYHREGRMAEYFFHSSGSFTQTVPVGPYLVETMHGFEYHPAAASATVNPGEITEITLSLERLTDLKELGWYSGDNHVHMNYAGNLRNTPENLVYMARAEDLDVIGELVANKDNRILDYQYFTGAPHALTDDTIVLYFNEEYRPPFYGHVSFINLTEHLISPFTTGYEGTAIESLYPSNTQMFRLARKQGALGAYVHPFWGNDDPLESDLGVAKAFPVDLALGTIDYHELVSGAGWAAYHVWHQALRNGYRLPAVGGEDAISSLHRTAIIGQVRAYAHMPDGLSWDAWLEAIRAGQLFVTNGPLLQLDVDGQPIGATVELPDGPSAVRVTGSVASIVPLDAVELVTGDSVYALGPLQGHSMEFEREIRIDQSTWLTLQAFADAPIHPIDDRFPQATTNPVWIEVAGQPVRSSQAADYFIRWIDKLTAMADEHPGWRSDAERAHVLGEFAEARQALVDRRAEAQALGR